MEWLMTKNLVQMEEHRHQVELLMRGRSQVYPSCQSLVGGFLFGVKHLIDVGNVIRKPQWPQL
jgi:hypothetical protein